MSAIPAELRLAGAWRPALGGLAALLLAIVLLYRETAAVMVGIWWRSETFTHAFLVLPISLWLIWRLRPRLAAMTPRAEPWILLPLLGAAAVWLLAELLVVNAPAQFAFVALLVLAVPAVLGIAVARAVMFPLLFLFFAVPFGEFMLPQMMDWTADFVIRALQFTGVPVFREGLHFVIPSGSWSVIDECSGVRYLIASFMVGSLFAYLNYRSYRRRAAFMAVSIVTPIIANWLRAYMIVMLGHLSGNKIAVGVDHLLYGWVFFGVVIFVMFTIGMRWAEADPQADAVPPAGGTAAEGGRPLLRNPAMAWAPAALAVLLPHVALWGMQAAERQATQPVLELPASLAGGWTAVDERLVDWKPGSSNPSASVMRTYAGPGGKVGVHIDYYRAQTAERKLVSSVNVMVSLNDRTWNRLGAGQREVEDAGGSRVTLRTTENLGAPAADARRVRLVTWQSYWIDGRYVAGDIGAKLAQTLARLRGRGDDGALLVLFAENESAAASHAAIEAFAKANLPLLSQQLQRTRDAR